MKIENTFTLAIPIDRAWAALNDPETVAPCFPGATLASYDGDGFAGTVKVKLGPISLTYDGAGRYVERDEAARRVVIRATGRDSKGSGTASATVTGAMAALGDDATEVRMVTDLAITGRPAQFGRGVISDVSEKLINQFASCLGERLVDSGGPAGIAPDDAPTAQKQGQAIDLLQLGGPAVSRFAQIGAAALVFVAILLVIRRSAR